MIWNDEDENELRRKEAGVSKEGNTRKVEYYENTSYITAHDLSTCSCRIFNKKNTYLDSIGKNYQLKVETKIEKNITIEKMSIINKLEYIEGE